MSAPSSDVPRGGRTVVDGTDGTQLLEEDHRRILSLLTQLEEHAEATPRRVLDDLRQEMSVHSAIEIEHFYPFVARHLDGGLDVAKQGRLDHEELDMTLYRLLEVVGTSSEYRAELTKLVADTRAHVEHEDRRLFPALRQVASPEELAKLGHRLEHAKHHAPTHPHPSALKSAIGSRLAHRLVGAVDRVRDRRSG